jgi:hypothetical protein
MAARHGAARGAADGAEPTQKAGSLGEERHREVEAAVQLELLAEEHTDGHSAAKTAVSAHPLQLFPPGDSRLC